MVRTIKRIIQTVANQAGIFRAVAKSQWRRRRLLIIGFHGISLADEHVWSPELYMSPANLRRRFEIIAASGCTVLPLDEAVNSLYRGDLPPAAVTLTFDDGDYDFFAAAFPVLLDFGFPATVYQSTYYSVYNRPVFDVALPYILWKAVRDPIDALPFTGEQGMLDLSNLQAKYRAADTIYQKALQRYLSAEEKDKLLEELASVVGVDYQEIRSRRLLHLMKPDEIREVAARGIDLQLHTHRHRMPHTRELMLREIQDNRSLLEPLTGRPAVHFCYPAGVHFQDVLPWLKEAGVRSATTCVPGLCSPSSDPLLLPRLIDSQTLSELEFRAWLSGFAGMLPSRTARRARDRDTYPTTVH
jgi:peptidoglycan/xylan/chitin deacetylase (PgdA/CDA1 family)